MTTDGGGWTAIDTTTARKMVNAAGSGGLAGYGSIRQVGYYSDTDRPYFLNNDAGGARYDIPLDITYDEFYMDSVRFRPTSFIDTSNSHTSEYLVHTGDYVMTDWSDTDGNGCDGDIGFGSPSDSGPAATFAESGTGFEETGSTIPDHLATFHANGDIYTVTQEDTFRMQFTESCGQDEGWMWHDGRVFVR